MGGMSFSFQKSPCGAMAISSCQARNDGGYTSVSVAASVMPYHGFGNGYNAATNIGTQGTFYGGPGQQNYEIIGGPGEGNGPPLNETFDTGDITYTYQKKESRVDWDTGGWVSKIREYYNYWINGYGVSTIVTHASTYGGDFGALPVGYNWVVDDPGTSAVTSTGVTRTMTVFSFGSTPRPIVFSSILSQRRDYSDVSSDGMAMLELIGTPPLLSTVGLSSGIERVDVIWPSGAGANTISQNTGYQYLVAAARGVATNSSGSALNGLSIASQGFSMGLSTRAIICAKSRWNLKNRDWSGSGNKPKAPFALYHHPLDASTFAPLSVVDLSKTLMIQKHEFTPSIIPSATHTGSDIPPVSYTPPYSPPYNPGGYGELGFNSTAA
jgi:hypothetical protein